MSGDPEQEFVSDGVAEDVITALSRYPSLFVIARNSSFTFKGRAVDVRQVGRERERVQAWRTALRCRPI
jgi:adenylate cyclase